MNASDTDLRTRIPWFLFTMLLCLLMVVPEAVAQSRGARGSTSTEGGRTERSKTERSEGSRAEQPRATTRRESSGGTRAEQPRSSTRTEQPRSSTRGETRAEPSRTEPSSQARGTSRTTSRGSSRDNDRSDRGTASTRDADDARTSRSARGQTRAGTVGSRGATSRDGRNDTWRDDDRNDGWRSDRRTDVRWRSNRFRPVQRRIYIPPRRYYRPHYRRPGIHLHIDWPWMHRYHRGWAPRYLYRQVVYVESGWASRRYDSRLDVRTYYRHRVLDASWDRAEVDVLIDRVEIYRDGRYLGAVERIPSDLERIHAVVYRNGDVRFDRDVFIVGDPRTGFEMISTRHYDGFVIDAYHRSHGYRAGALDLRRERVVPVRYSRLFDPYDFNGFVPISLLPEDTGWLVDVGHESPSGYYWGDDEEYYYGRGNDGGYNYGTDPYGGQTYDDDPYYDRQSPSMQVQPGTPPPAPGADLEPFRDEQEHQYRTERGGADIRLKRETELKRIE